MGGGRHCTQLTCNAGVCLDFYEVNGVKYIQNMGNVNYEINVSNAGVALFGNVTVRCTLDAALSYNPIGSGGWTVIPPAVNNVFEISQPLGFLQSVTLPMNALLNYANTTNCLTEMKSTVEIIYTTPFGTYTISKDHILYSVPDNYIMMTTTNSSLLGNTLSGNYFLDGLLTVDNYFELLACNMIMGEGAAIEVGDGLASWQLNLNQSTLSACATIMWEGIRVKEQSQIQAKNSTISDAYRGISLNPATTGIITDMTFQNNRTGIYGYATLNSPVNLVFAGSTLLEATLGYLAIPFSGQPESNGTMPFAGIDIENIDLNVNASATCDFRNLNIGIKSHGATLDLQNCYFDAIKKDVTYNNPNLILNAMNGAGVATKSATLTFTGAGFAPSSPISFEDCDQGIVSFASSIDITNTRMEEIHFTAIRFVPFKFFPAQIKNNRITSYRVGVSAEQCEFSSAVDISLNFITLSFWEPGTINPIASAIQVLEAFPPNSDNVIIHNNGIRLDRPGNGIYLNACRGTSAYSNSIMLNDTITGSYPNGTNGVLIQGGEEIYLNCNFISQLNGGNLAQINNPNLPANEQFTGINTFDSQNWKFMCNNVNAMHNAMSFTGICNAPFLAANSTGLYKNSMYESFTGLYLSPTGIIGQQGTLTVWGDNKWNLPFVAAVNLGYFGSGFGAWSDNMAAPVNSRFDVRNFSPIPGNDAFFPTFNTPNWFTGYLSLFVPEGCGNNCAPIIDSGGGQLVSDYDHQVARSEEIVSEYLPEMLWMAQSNLYKKIEANLTLLSDSLLNQFYTTFTPTSLAEFIRLENIQNAGLSAKSFEIEQDSLLFATILSGRESLKTQDSLLTISNNIQDSAAILLQRLAVLTSLAQAQADLSAFWQSRYSQTQALADSFRVINQNINSQSLWETNRKKINEVYLSTIAQNQFSLTAEQQTDIADIAFQCPLSGGTAVFEARSLYFLWFGGQSFDDHENCSVQGLVYRKPKNQPSEIAYKVYPNPASNQITVELPSILQNATLQIYNLQGQLVKGISLNEDEYIYKIEIGSLQSGMYLFEVIEDKQLVKSGKIVIIR